MLRGYGMTRLWNAYTLRLWTAGPSGTSFGYGFLRLRATIASAGIGGLNAGPYLSGFRVPLTARIASRVPARLPIDTVRYRLKPAKDAASGVAELLTKIGK